MLTVFVTLLIVNIITSSLLILAILSFMRGYRELLTQQQRRRRQILDKMNTAAEVIRQEILNKEAKSKRARGQ